MTFDENFSGSLTSINLKSNRLGDEGWRAIFDALRDNPQNKITKWDLFNQGINPTIAKSLAAYVAVSPSLTKLDVSHNNLGADGEAALQKAVEGRSEFGLLL